MIFAKIPLRPARWLDLTGAVWRNCPTAFVFLTRPSGFAPFAERLFPLNSNSLSPSPAAAALPRWRLPRLALSRWQWLAAGLSLVTLISLAVILASFLHIDGEIWAHLSEFVLPRLLANTALLLLGVSLGVLAAVRTALAEFEKLGATLVDVSLPLTELSIPVYYVIAPAEASSNLSRFDGVRYGHRAAQYTDLNDMYKKSRSEGFGDEATRRIMIGTYVLSHGYYDAYYLKAQKIRRLIAQDFQTAFAQCDVIAGPVSPTVAWKIGEKSADPVANYLADIYTLSSSLAGLPGMSIPAGFGAGGMPVGLQLIGNYFKEAQLLGAAHQFQLATDWHLRNPAKQV